jgi:hypothetical protein
MGDRDDILCGDSTGLGGHLAHGLESLLDLSDLVKVVGILGLLQGSKEVLDGLSLLEPLLNQWLGGRGFFLGGDALLGGLAADSLGL